MHNDQPTPMYGVLVNNTPPPALAARGLVLSAGAVLLIPVLLLAVLLAGCATPAGQLPGMPPQRSPLPEVRAALSEMATPRPAQLPPSVAEALVPKADLSMPTLANRPPEPRFDLNVVNLPVAQVFAALAKDTRYSMLVDPELKGNVTVNLKDVTLLEALETLREMYGFEYRVQGARIFVQPATLQTRVFQVNYLTMNRAGRSDVRVTSGSISQGSTGGSNIGSNVNSSTGNVGGSGSSASTLESSRVTTSIRNDVWAELEASLKLLLGGGDKQAEGRQLIVSPQSGVIVVRALPRELRAVEQFLSAARLNVERQVILEAKILDVRLADGAQMGVNWAAFRTGDNSGLSTGLLSPGAKLRPRGATGTELNSGNLTSTPGLNLSLDANALTGVFGLAFQTSNFAAMLQFLETQGSVQVLSSPRIAALNNQKAVLKVGTDDFFVTNVSTNIQTGAAGGQPISTPTITVQPFFSGVALDVTPQIDEDGNIILHVHPSVTDVTEKPKVVNLGTLGNFTLPLASSQISETDTIVRVRDGNIVAIGGLMRTAQAERTTQLPGLGNVPLLGSAFRSSGRATEKSELIILIKPTVIHSDGQFAGLRDELLQRLDAMTATR
ncbi:MAG: pilus (MSHA type) biogenesis protein MshL [Betaproteobacteria bacterium]